MVAVGDVVDFARAARLLDLAARQGLDCPGFRSPPRIAGPRSLRRRAGGPALVAVRLVGRHPHEVHADMIEGVVVANGLSGEAAERCRRRLWRALAAGVRAA
jgi:hypothetical protein